MFKRKNSFIFAVFFALAPLAAFSDSTETGGACPVLEGIFTCDTIFGTVRSIVSREQDSSGTLVFRFQTSVEGRTEESRYIVDGKKHSHDSSGKFDAYVVNCSEGVLNILFFRTFEKRREVFPGS